MTERELERARLRNYLLADAGPLALAEVESAAQADDLVAALQTDPELRPRLRVCRVDPDHGWPQALEWLEASQHPLSASPVFILHAPAAREGDDGRARQLWTWMNDQRERWKPSDAQVIFLLSPSQVDRLARHARSLWDWIPLKFNLLRPLPPRPDGLGQMPDAPASGAQTPGDAAKLLPGLRDQYFRARQKGLSEAVVCRDYAWPLFRTLVEAGHVGEARRLLDTDLRNVPPHLAEQDERQWLSTIGSLHVLRHELGLAEEAYSALLRSAHGEDDAETRAAALFGLATVAMERREFGEAERHYREVLALAERTGNDAGLASTLHQLGRAAEERRDLDTAERFYRESLTIRERLGKEAGRAITLHQLGRVAEERRDLDTAERFYRDSLAIEERLGDEHARARTLHQLGMIAEQRRDLDTAERFCRQSLTIKERLGDEHGRAITLYQLGMIAQKRRDLDTAERFCRGSLGIQERLGNEHARAMSLHQLGTIAEARDDVEGARRLYEQAASIFGRFGDEDRLTVVQRAIERVVASRTAH